MAQGLISRFESIRPGETIQGLIDPTWPGLVKGSGTMDPNAAWPLLGVTAARSLPAAGSFIKRGSKEIIDSAGDVVNLARKFPKHARLIKDIITGDVVGRKLRKVTEKLENKEYPFDVGGQEEDAGEFLGPGTYGARKLEDQEFPLRIGNKYLDRLPDGTIVEIDEEDDIDIPEDEEEIDRQLRESGIDPDDLVRRTLEKIEKSNVVSLDEFRGDKEIERQRAEDAEQIHEMWATTGLMRHELDAGGELGEYDQRFINYILFNQMLPDDELDLRAWSREDIEDRLESSWYGTVDRMFTDLNDEDMDLLKNDMEVIIDHVSTRLKRDPDVDYGGEVVEFPIDAGDSEPSDEVVFGDSKVLEFKDHPDLPRKVIELPNSPFHVSVIRLPDDTYKVKALDVRSREIKELPGEIAELFTSKLNSKDIERAIKLLEAFFSWED